SSPALGAEAAPPLPAAVPAGLSRLITDRFAVPVAAPIGAATGITGPDRQRDRDSPGRQNQATMPRNKASAYFCRPDSDSTSFAASGVRISAHSTMTSGTEAFFSPARSGRRLIASSPYARFGVKESPIALPNAFASATEAFSVLSSSPG